MQTRSRVGIALVAAMLLATPQVAAAAPADEQPSPIHHYSFDKSDGADAVGNRHAKAGEYKFVDGKKGKALRIENGAGMTFESTNPIGEQDPWTISYWVRTDSDPVDRVSVLMDAEKNYSFDLKMAADRSSGYHVGKNPGDVLTFAHSFKAGAWQHVTWTQSKEVGLSMYVDGKLIETNAWTKNNRALAPLDIIGGTGFTGEIDELQIFNKVLNGDQVKKLAGIEEEEVVTEELPWQNTIAEYKLASKHLSTVMREPGGKRQYLGQPDLIRTNTGRLITAFPEGHGKGPLIMMISENDGETWTEKTDIPASWAGSQETPTMFKLNMPDGTERLMLITANPGWGTDSAGHKHGWNTSYSDDNGDTWSEYSHFHSEITLNGEQIENKAIVGMASLVQLKDENGNLIPKWMGVYHNYDFVNFKTYLTFENGVETWSEPTPYLAEYREIEKTYRMCEIGMFRSPDGKRIVGLARSNSHMHRATMIYSDDEGETWSKPVELPGSLAGERHKPSYDPVTGRVVIPMREIRYDLNNNGAHDGGTDWLAGNWVAWVGTYEQLMNQEEGQYRILLAEDYARNTYGGDTGYTGVVTLEDGTFIMVSYGHFDYEFSRNWRDPNRKYQYYVTTDLAYIKQAKFRLWDVEQANGVNIAPAPVTPEPTNDVIGAIHYAWAQAGGADGYFGEPTSGEIDLGGHRVVQHFENGDAYWAPGAGAWFVHDGNRAEWQRLGGIDGFLGAPTGNEVSLGGDVVVQTFQGGRIYWSPQYGARAVHGGILARFLAGGGHEVLGVPTTGEYPFVGGVRQDFVRSVIVWP